MAGASKRTTRRSERSNAPTKPPSGAKSKAADNGASSGDAVGAIPQAGAGSPLPPITLNVTSEEPKKQKPPRMAPPLTDKEKQERAKAAAQTVVMTVESAAVGVSGTDDARMTRGERTSIEAPLGRMLERADPQLVETVSTWADPFALALGTFAWLSRVVRLMAEPVEADPAPGPMAEPGEVYGDNEVGSIVPPDPATVRAQLGSAVINREAFLRP